MDVPRDTRQGDDGLDPSPDPKHGRVRVVPPAEIPPPIMPCPVCCACKLSFGGGGGR